MHENESQSDGVEFDAGFGRAEYPSSHDGDRFVDATLSLQGRYSDEDVDAFLREGRIHRYRNASDDLPIPASKLSEDAAGAVFAMGAMLQAEALAAPPERVNLNVGRMRYVVARAIEVPEWLRGVTQFVGQAVRHDDFEAMGALYALRRLAAGESVDRGNAHQAGIELHRLAMRAQSLSERWDDAS